MALPVTDKEGRLVGIITVDDIVDVIEQETTEDFEKMAALLPSDEEYLKTSVFELAKNRIVWLCVLMLSGTISAVIINGYEGLLSAAVVLSSFIPTLTGTGGNAGSQASTIIIRGMAVGEIETKIGAYIADFIHDGDTFQLGIGGIPNAVAQSLKNKKNLPKSLQSW